MAPISKPAPHRRVPNRTVSKRRKAKRAASERIRLNVYALVDARDGWRCRATQVYLGTAAHRHHMKPRARGGLHTTANIVTVAPMVHQWLHAHMITVSGSADETLIFTDTKSGISWTSPCLYISTP